MPDGRRLTYWTDNTGTRSEIEAIMKDEPGNAGLATTGDTGTRALPAVADRATWQAQLDGLLVREKAHTREGDAIAAARRPEQRSRCGGAGPRLRAARHDGVRPTRDLGRLSSRLASIVRNQR